MISDFLTVRPDSHVIEAQRIMRHSEIEALTVLDESDQIVGFVTRADIEDRLIRRGKNPRTTYVRDAMTPRLIRADESTSIEEATRIMRENGIRHLAVVDSNQQVIGIVNDEIIKRYGSAA